MVQRILVTGASGFVGSYLRPMLKARWPDAAISGLGMRKDVGASQDLIAVDLLDAEALAEVVRKAAPDTVIHLAAQASVALADRDARDMTWAVNLGGSLNLASAISAHCPDATLLFVSTAEVYGASFLGGVVNETSLTLPMNVYAKSKLIAEQMFAAALPERTQLVVARPFNHTGPGQREAFVLPSFAAQVARIEAGAQPPRMVVGNLDVRRDFLDVRDVAAAYVALLEAAPRLPRRFTCNIASGTPRLRPVDRPSACGDAMLLRATTGWTPEIPMDTTLDALVMAARQNLAKQET